MPEFIPVLTEKDIQEKLSVLAERISTDYQNKSLVLIGVLKGAFVFMADLMRKLTIPVSIDFIWLSSYGDGDVSSGKVTRISDITTDIRGKDVLIVEDIVDTGLTMRALFSCISAYAPRSIKVCAFIDKFGRRQTEFHSDYTCHSVKDGFLVGYGLDYAEQYRHLPAIYELKISNGEVK